MSGSNSVECLIPKNARLSTKDIFILQLAPGIVSLLAYAILAYFFPVSSFPRILVLTIAFLFAEVPFTWWLLIRRLKQETGKGFSFKAAFPWWKKVPAWIYLALGVPIIFINIAFAMGGQVVLDPYLIATFFNWLPDWFVLTFGPGMLANTPQGMIWTVWGLSLFGVIIGGFTQEAYSRGFLLPRMAHLGWRAPILSAGLFAVMHFIGPWVWPIVFINALFWAILVYWRRSLKIGLFLHIGMLFVQWLMLTLIAFGIFQPPAGGM